MAGYNRIIMIGNLTRDPEYRQVPSGQAVCRLGLASNRQYKNRQSGSMVQEVCYVDIDVWGAQAESCRQYLQKGRPVLVEGRLKFDSWKDNEGQPRSKHSIVADRVVFLSGAAEATAGGSYGERADDSSRIDPNNALEKDIMDQLDSIKSKQKVQAASKAKEKKVDQPQTENVMGGVNLPDEQPFEDDLPF